MLGNGSNYGTCMDVWDKIKETGELKNPYLASNINLARYYAEESSVELMGGYPVVLKVVIPDVEKLRYDRNSMDEPVMVSEDSVSYILDKVSQSYPEWEDNGMISVSSYYWELSWNIVGSVRYEGSIPIKFIEEV